MEIRGEPYNGRESKGLGVLKVTAEVKTKVDSRGKSYVRGDWHTVASTLS